MYKFCNNLMRAVNYISSNLFRSWCHLLLFLRQRIMNEITKYTNITCSTSCLFIANCTTSCFNNNFYLYTLALCATRFVPSRSFRVAARKGVREGEDMIPSSLRSVCTLLPSLIACAKGKIRLETNPALSNKCYFGPHDVLGFKHVLSIFHIRV